MMDICCVILGGIAGGIFGGIIGRKIYELECWYKDRKKEVTK